MPPTTKFKAPHLELVPFKRAHLIALIEEPESFQAASGFAAADGLRDFFVSGDVDPAWLTNLKSMPDPGPWNTGFAVVDVETQSIVGSGGFKGPPDDDGVAEIAYGIVPVFQGRGYATEVAARLTAYCLDNGVRLVRAHTLPVPNASNHILGKCGFQFAGEIVDPQDGPVWRWEHSAP